MEAGGVTLPTPPPPPSLPADSWIFPLYSPPRGYLHGSDLSGDNRSFKGTVSRDGFGF
jgi:hypothetical protein